VAIAIAFGYLLASLRNRYVEGQWMNNIKVLLVDDEYFNYEMLTLALGERFEVCYVGSGQEALAKTVESQPDVLLLDVCMPGIDGYDTCRLIKNTPETKNIPVIMVTGLESQSEKDEAYRAGCDDYITKPFDMSELKEKIEHYSAQNKS